MLTLLVIAKILCHRQDVYYASKGHSSTTTLFLAIDENADAGGWLAALREAHKRSIEAQATRKILSSVSMRSKKENARKHVGAKEAAVALSL